MVGRKASPRKRRSLTLQARKLSNLQPMRRPVAAAMATPSKGPACSNIRVLLRVRPALRKDMEEQRWRDVVEVVDKNLVIFDPKEEEDPFFLHGKKQAYRDITKRQRKNLQFNFDHVFGQEETTAEVYCKSIQSLIANLLNGYNCSVFAYGATGSGKTHTMLGTPDTPGVTPLLMRELYATLAELENADVDVIISYLEIYNEAVHDLLVDQAQVRLLQLREKDDGSVIVPELTWHKPSSADDLMAMLQLGNQRRTQHPTDANAESSRSHAVFQVVVKTKRRSEARADKLCCAKLSMIDLAGSERAAATNNNRPRFTEGANINKSLLALGNCINALADGQKHVPFRNSKLTRLLKGSLGGNCQTVMIANVSPSSQVYEDTYNTLKYATRAKKIKNRVKKNLVSMDITAAEFSRAMEEAQVEISTLRAQNAKLVSENQMLRAAMAAGGTASPGVTAAPANPLGTTTVNGMVVAAPSTSGSLPSTPIATPVVGTSAGTPVIVQGDQDATLHARIAELEAENAALRKSSASPTPPCTPVTSPKVAGEVTPVAASPEAASAMSRVMARLDELAVVGRRLEESVELRHSLMAQLEMLEYNFERKKLKIERINELKKDSTQTKVHSLEVKTQTQRASLEARLLLAGQREGLERGSVDECLLGLQREAEGAWGDVAKAVMPLFAVKFDLTEAKLRLANARGLDSLRCSDLSALHLSFMSTAALLHKTFFVLKGLGSTSADMEAQYEAVVSQTRRPASVTFQKTPEAVQPPEEPEVEEVMAEPLNATFCIPPVVASTSHVPAVVPTVVPLVPRITVMAPASTVRSTVAPTTMLASLSTVRSTVAPTTVLAPVSTNRTLLLPPPQAKKTRLTPPSVPTKVPSLMPPPRGVATPSMGTPRVLGSVKPVTSAGRRKRTPIRNNYKKFKKGPIAFNKENRTS